MIVSQVVAISQNHAIGKDNQLIWHLPADLKHFKNVTMGHHMIMGRKTFESIGKPLPGRTTIIITRDKNYKADGCIVVNSLEEAIETARKADDTEACIVGGGEIFKQAMDLTDKIYLTIIEERFEADIFYPELDPKEWALASREDFKPDEKNKYYYSFCEYTRIK
nr:Dihydrofolate reductase [uncultured bacterium]